MLLNVIPLNLYNDPKSWDAHFSPSYPLSPFLYPSLCPQETFLWILLTGFLIHWFFLGSGQCKVQQDSSWPEKKSKVCFPLAPSVLDQGLAPSLFLVKGHSSSWVALPKATAIALSFYDNCPLPVPSDPFHSASTCLVGFSEP